MSHPDEGRLQALADGELAPQEAAEVLAHCRTCAECGVRLEEARALLGESDRIIAKLDLPPRRETYVTRTPRRPATDFRVLGLAASALLVVTVGWFALRPSSTPAGERMQQPPQPTSTDAVEPAPQSAPAAAAPSSPAVKDAPAPFAANTDVARREAAKADELAKTTQERKEETVTADKQLGRVQAAEQAAPADTPPAQPASGVALNDLPPWKARAAAPSAPPVEARYRLEGLDVVSSTPLAGGGIRLKYSVNGTPVEFDQVPATARGDTPAPGTGVHELSWPRDDFKLTLRSTLPTEELERLRQTVR